MDKPAVKNIILIGIPTIISAISIIMALEKFNRYKNIFIFITVILLLFFILSLIYYSNKEKNEKNEIKDLKTTILTMTKVMGINAKTISSIVNFLDIWNGDINKIANNILEEGFANERDWNLDKIYNDICVCCRDSICKFVRSEKDTDISVSLIKCYQRDRKDYIKMVAHSSPQTAKPDVYNKEFLLDNCNYYFGELIRKKNREIKAFENSAKIQANFYKANNNTDLTKYQQYIAVPIYCSSGKILGLLQITTKYNYIIMEEEVELIRFGEVYLTPFVELLTLAEKIGKGMFAKPKKRMG